MNCPRSLSAKPLAFTPAEGKQTKAVNVLIEHRRASTVALYLPWKRKLFGDHIFGEVMALPAKPEVHPWGGGVSA